MRGFLWTGAGSLFAHLGRRGANPGYCGRSGLSPQLEKVVPSLEGCAIAQNLPVSAIPGTVAGLRAQSAGRKRWPFPWSAMGKRQSLPASATRGAPGEGSSSVHSRRRRSSLKCGGHRQNQPRPRITTLRGASPVPEHTEQDFES